MGVAVNSFQEQINDLQMLINDLRVEVTDEELQGRQYLARAIRILSEAVLDLQLRVEAIEGKSAGTSDVEEKE